MKQTVASGAYQPLLVFDNAWRRSISIRSSTKDLHLAWSAQAAAKPTRAPRLRRDGRVTACARGWARRAQPGDASVARPGRGAPQ